ncbi:hypothetical protein LK10_19370 [Sinomonas humi]|uniref:Uncharacterized protein n=1 Tax=Sinomonas humi TaxID=1338436 RepID=A0A0B2AFL6_9MICC|nr:hypothetical protein LK10_19370 [Sinomonas humi]
MEADEGWPGFDAEAWLGCCAECWPEPWIGAVGAVSALGRLSAPCGATFERSGVAPPSVA